MKSTRCSDVRAAVAATLQSGSGATCISWRGEEDRHVVLGALTPFGPVVRRWNNVDAAFVDRLIVETERAGAGPVFLSENASEPLEIVASGVSGFRAEVPIRSVGPGAGTSLWWSIAPLGDDPEYAVGDELRVSVEFDNAGWAIRYRSVEGRDAGLHAILVREPTLEQREIVLRSRAVVERHAYGSAFDQDEGEIRVQILMLAIPHELANAFPDGKLPRRLPALTKTG